MEKKNVLPIFRKTSLKFWVYCEKIFPKISENFKLFLWKI